MELRWGFAIDLRSRHRCAEAFNILGWCIVDLPVWRGQLINTKNRCRHRLLRLDGLQRLGCARQRMDQRGSRKNERHQKGDNDRAGTNYALHHHNPSNPHISIRR